MRSIDKSEWPRREIFDFFGRVADPFYMVSFNAEVTELYRYAKAKRLSFYHSMIWLCTMALNGTEAFRFAARGDDDILLLDGRRPSFTHLDRGSELFKIITLPCEGGLEEFCRAAAEKTAAQSAFIDAGAEGDDLIYFSCLPWVELTALTNERDTGSSRLDSIPRVAWGKYFERGGGIYVNISIEVNHRFIDGVHIGRFADAIGSISASLVSEP